MLDNNNNEVFDEMSSSDYIELGYKEFGKHVNSQRHIPMTVDGLKPVYRHVLQACYELPDKMTKTVAIVGDCLKKYHFTGDASVGPVVSALVNNGLLEGQGNHGNYVLRGENDSHAATRYTEARINSTVRSQLDKIAQYIPSTTSATGFEEWDYFPTPIPLTLVFGALGIGLGIGTRIPPFTIKSLYDAYINNDYHLLKINYGYEIDQESIENGLKNLWENGRGSLKLKIPYKPTKISGDFGYVISCEPQIFKPYGYGLKKLEEWESYGYLSIEDISDTVPKLFITRTSRTRAIDESMIEEQIKIACEKKLGYVCSVWDPEQQIAGVMGIRDWISISINNYKKLYEMYRSDNLDRLHFEWVMWRDFPRAAQLITETNDDRKTPKYSYEEIVKIINEENLYRKGEKFRNEYVEFTIDHIQAIGRKSLNTLRNADASIKLKEIEKSIEDFKNLNIDNEIKAYVDSYSINVA